MHPKVTAYISTYNRPEFLREALQSAMDQTCKDMKIVILDNGSKERYAEELVNSIDTPRLSCIRIENNIKEGIWNYAFDNADTEYVNILHDDDIMFPWMIEEEMKILEERPSVGMVGSKPLLSAGVIKIPDRPSSMSAVFYGHKEFVSELCRVGYNPLISSCVLFRLSDINKHNLRYGTEYSSEDLHFWLRCNIYGTFEICVIEEPLFQYRVHGKSGTALSVAEGIWEMGAKHVDNFLKKECPDIDAARLKELFAIWCLMPAMRKYCLGLIGMDALLAERKRVEDQYGWYLPDWRFEDKLAVSYLEDLVLAVKAGQKTMGDYLDAIAEAEKLDIRVSWKRHKIWFGDSYIQV